MILARPLREVDTLKMMRGCIAFLKHFMPNLAMWFLYFAKAFGVRKGARVGLMHLRFDSGRIDDQADLGNSLRRKAALTGVFTN
jgi:hypothetical protein